MTFPLHDPVLIFSIVMTLVLISPLIFKKIRLPGSIGLITSGIIIGPHLFGILERDQTIELLGTIGLLYIMFQAGLEINLESLKKDRHNTAKFGISTFLFPLILGTFAGYYVLGMNIVASILLASMFSSHTLLTFPVVSRLGLSKKRAVTITVGGTIITDTLALLILAVIVSSRHGRLDLSFWVNLVLSISLYSYLIIRFLPRIGSWFFRNFSSDTGVEEYAFVFTAMFISAFFSHIASLEPIIGAFLAGLTLNSLIPDKSMLMNHIQFVGNSLFIPFFLISTGMLINPGLLLTDLTTIRVSITMIIIAVLSKYIAARFFTKISGFSSAETGIIFGLSVSQAAATLAVVIIGYRVEIFGEPVLTGTIMMILITTFIGSIVTEKYSRKLILTGGESFESESAGTLDRILIPISKPDKVNEMIDLAVLLHPKGSKEPLYPMHIALEGRNSEKDIIDGENILTKASIRASTMQKQVLPLLKIDYKISSGIIKAIAEQRISKVILGWNEPASFKHKFFDSIIEQLVDSSDEMIFISRLVKPLNITRRIILIIPPFINKQYGFTDTLSSIIKLCNDLHARITVFAESETYAEIKHHFKASEKEAGFVEVKSWKNLCRELHKTVSQNDMFIQMISRQGRIAWRLSFDQMPYRIKQNFPDNNLIVVYPYYHPEEYEDTSEIFPEDLNLLNEIPGDNYIINTRENNPVKIFQYIAEKHYPDISENITTELSSVLRDYPIDLSPDILLIHTHTEQVQGSQIYPAVNRSGFDIPDSGSKPRILIVLVVPESQPVQQHLNILSQISRMVMVKTLTDNIIKADDYDHFLKLMKKN